MATMEEIKDKTTEFADKRELLRLYIDELHAKIEETKREYLPRIQKAADDAANARKEVETLIEEGKHLFVRPRTVIVSGIKVGLEKGKGSVSYDDEAMVIRRIKKVFGKPEEQELYIKTTEKVKKKPLSDLDLATLKRLGVTVDGTGDVVVIKPTQSDVEKLVTALLKDRDGGDGEDLAEAV